MIRAALAFLALVCFAFTPALADRPPTRFEINFGAYAPRMDTVVRLDGSGGQVGVELNFEDDFNLEDTKIVPVVDGSLWLSKKHGLGLIAFDLSRTSNGQSTISFRFGDQIFPADVPLAIRFDTTVVALTYAYKFFNNEKRSFGINAGLNINKIEAGITTTEGPEITESGDVTAPLPVFGVNGHVLLGKKWKFYGTVGIFGLSFDQYDGFLSSVSGGFIHQTFKNVGFGVGLYSFNVNFDSENEDFLGSIRYGYNGPIAYLNVHF